MTEEQKTKLRTLIEAANVARDKRVKAMEEVEIARQALTMATNHAKNAGAAVDRFIDNPEGDLVE